MSFVLVYTSKFLLLGSTSIYLSIEYLKKSKSHISRSHVKLNVVLIDRTSIYELWKAFVWRNSNLSLSSITSEIIKSVIHPFSIWNCFFIKREAYILVTICSFMPHMQTQFVFESDSCFLSKKYLIENYECVNSTCILSETVLVTTNGSSRIPFLQLLWVLWWSSWDLLSL